MLTKKLKDSLISITSYTSKESTSKEKLTSPMFLLK